MTRTRYLVLNDEQKAFAVECYKTMSASKVADEIAQRFGIEIDGGQVKSLMRRLSVKTGKGKPHHKRAYTKGSGLQKGQTNGGSFPKGNKPHNFKPAGSIRISSDGYKWIKLETGKWKQLHQHIWQQAHGDIPKTHTLTFLDNDPLNCALENLLLMSKADMAVMAKFQYTKLTGHAKLTALAEVQVRRKISDKRKQIGMSDFSYKKLMRQHTQHLEQA